MLMARTLEAERPIIAIDRHAAGRAFVTVIPDTDEPLHFLLDQFIAPSGPAVEGSASLR